MLRKQFYKLYLNFAIDAKITSSLLSTPTRTLSSSSLTPQHIPVLCTEAINYLNSLQKSPKIFIDMTFGAGGHTYKLLETCQDAKIFALDRDPIAHEIAKKMSEKYPNQIIPLLGKFSELPQLLQHHGVQRASVDGILFDFGCSSMQFDVAERGFSVSKTGPLDMRMDRGRNSDQITAADVLARIEETDLVKILRIYGEEKAAKKIARAIIEARSAFFKIETTKQLADLVASCLNETHKLDKLQRPMHVATKTFQALRIFVNNELNEINYAMILAAEYLRMQGVLVAITFHSLEDTIVKRHIDGNVIEGRANPIPLKYCSHDVTHDKELIETFRETRWKQMHKHVIIPNIDEISRNPRSRSAKLRAALKIK